MRRIYCLLFFILMIELITSCASRELTLGAEKVYLYSQPPKSCKFLGYITNPNVHGNSALGASNQDLKKDDINFLKNEGSKLGANVVVLNTHTRNEIKRRAGGKTPIYTTSIEHNVSASAYLCPPSMLHKAKQGVNIQEDHST